jgi:iron complex outermembrane receptor protein
MRMICGVNVVRKVTLAATSAAWVLFSTIASAVEADDGSGQPPENTIVVTASRIEQPLDRAPAAVTVIDQTAIQNRNVQRITDALWKTPSLYLGRGGNGQVATLEPGFSLRGMTTNRVLVLVDGLLPLQNGNSQGVNFLTLFPDDIERVEVVPGAFAALYGSNAIGGVINNITKRPNKRELTVRYSRGTGDGSGDFPSIYFRDRVAGGLGIAAGIAYNRVDGFISQAIVRPPVAGAPGAAVTGAIPTTTRQGEPAFIVGDRGREPWKQFNAVLKAEYEFNADHRIYAGAAYADAEIGFTPFNTLLRNAAGQLVSTGTVGINGQRVTLATSNFVGSSPLSESSWRYFGGYVGTVGKAEIKAEVAHTDREAKNPTIGTGATETSGPGTLNSSPNQTTSGIVTIAVPIGSQHQVVAGVQIQEDTVNRRVFDVTNWRDPSTTTTIRNGYDGRSLTASAFIQDAFTPIPDLTLYLGARLDHWETRGNFFQNTAPVSAITYAERSVTSLNPKIAAVGKPSTNLTLRAAWGRSFRSPSNLDLYSTTVSSNTTSPTGILTVQSDPNLQPERGSSWELGTDWRPVPAVRLFGNVYETRLRDFIGSRQISLALTQRINTGRVRVRGLEIGVSARITDWLEADANASFIDSRVLENAVDPLSVGKRLTQVPDRIAYVGLTATPGKFIGVLEARYTDNIFITAQNLDTFQGVPTAYDEHVQVNAKIGYRFNRVLRANIAVNNLLDARIYQFSLMPGRNFTFELVASLF